MLARLLNAPAKKKRKTFTECVSKNAAQNAFEGACSPLGAFSRRFHTRACFVRSRVTLAHTHVIYIFASSHICTQILNTRGAHSLCHTLGTHPHTSFSRPPSAVRCLCDTAMMSAEEEEAADATTELVEILNLCPSLPAAYLLDCLTAIMNTVIRDAGTSSALVRSLIVNTLTMACRLPSLHGGSALPLLLLRIHSDDYYDWIGASGRASLCRDGAFSFLVSVHTSGRAPPRALLPACLKVMRTVLPYLRLSLGFSLKECVWFC